MYMDNWRPGGTDWMDLDLVGQQSGAHHLQLKDEEMVPFAQPLLDYSLGAYIEGWIRNEIRLLKVRN
jgi:hypothetical protein